MIAVRKSTRPNGMRNIVSRRCRPRAWRERIFLEHFWQTLSPHPESFSESDRAMYTKAYAQEGAMRAAFEMFKTFDTQDAMDNRKFAATKLQMAVLTIEGDKAMGAPWRFRRKSSPTMSRQSYWQTPDTG